MKLGYNSSEVCKIANITYRQLHYWDKTNLVKPSISAATGTGSRRIYSFIDLVCLRATAKLKDEGISVQKIRKSVQYLTNHFPDHKKPLANFIFLTDGDTVFVLTEDPQTALDTLQSGQFVVSIAIGRMVADTMEKILSLERSEELTGHIFEVIIEPDKDVYLAYCPILPGCVTWGHTEAEAYQYIQDAVEAYLEDMVSDGDPVPGLGVVKTVEEINPVIRIRNGARKEAATA